MVGEVGETDAGEWTSAWIRVAATHAQRRYYWACVAASVASVGVRLGSGFYLEFWLQAVIRTLLSFSIAAAL